MKRWNCPTYIRTFTGKKFHADPRPEDICLEDIAHGLAIAPRWGGQSIIRYPVAAHSVYVMKMVPKQYRFDALMHDASEAYLCDLPKPWKEMMPEYQVLESKFMRAISTKFGFEWPLPRLVKTCDSTALREERRCKLFFNCPIEGDVSRSRPPKDCHLPDSWDFLWWSEASVEEIESSFIEYFHRCITERNRAAVLTPCGTNYRIAA